MKFHLTGYNPNLIKESLKKDKITIKMIIFFKFLQLDKYFVVFTHIVTNWRLIEVRS